MEDSEKRRERLKAMRTEAAQAETSSYTNPAANAGSLLNPLLDSPEQNVPLTAPRFDFYTDPMAAFSGNKRSGAGNQAQQNYYRPPHCSSSHAPRFSSSPSGSWNPRMTPPAHQMHNYHTPNPNMAPTPTYQMKSYQNVASHQGPLHPSDASGSFAHNYASQKGPYPVHAGNPAFQPRGNAPFNNRPNWHNSSPNRGSANHSGRGHWRGGGGRSQFSGQSGGRGRGRGFHSHSAASDEASRPESFYDKSMFEDPWENLEPVVWKGTPSSSGSWLPESVGVKKARVSEPSNKLNSQQSLAEYLAASFNEASDNYPGV